MSPVSALPALLALLSAVGTCFIITRLCGPPLEHGRFASIDGLRGYLALFVFFSHGCLWYFYLRDGLWMVPPSRLYTHMGESSVAMFFMITGFLFFSKIISAQGRGLDWTRLFVSRLLRLAPLYLFAMLWMFAIVAWLSEGEIRESTFLLAKHAVEWLAFCVVGGPNLNAVKSTLAITAGVTWSLQYEWFFYCALPALALCLRVIPPLRYIVLGLLAALAFPYLGPKIYNLLAFAGGISAALLSRAPEFRKFCSLRVASFIVIGCILAAVGLYPTVHESCPLLLLSIAFALIACGNSLFGIFVHPVSRTLGQMAYSLYLLHGIALFVVFNFVVGLRSSRDLSPTGHWMLVIGVTPVLVALCYATFRLIEHPAMRRTDDVMAWLRSGRIGRRLGHVINASPNC